VIGMERRNTSCQDENKEKHSIASEGKGLFLVLLGFLLVAVGAIILIVTDMLSSASQESFGVIVFVGPLPIVIGGGPNIQWLILLAVILAALSVTYLLIMIGGKKTLEG
jgi:uncharacterized membrane protein